MVKIAACWICGKQEGRYTKLSRKLLLFVQHKKPKVTADDLFCEECYKIIKKKYERLVELRRQEKLTSIVASTTSSSELSKTSLESSDKENQLISKNQKSKEKPIEPIISSQESKSIDSVLEEFGLNYKAKPIVQEPSGSSQKDKPSGSSLQSGSSSDTFIDMTDLDESPALKQKSTPSKAQVTPIVPQISTKRKSSLIEGSKKEAKKQKHEEPMVRLPVVAPIVAQNKPGPVQPIVGRKPRIVEEVEYYGSDDDIIDPAIPFPNVQPHIKRRTVIRSKNEPLNWSYKLGG